MKKLALYFLGAFACALLLTVLVLSLATSFSSINWVAFGVASVVSFCVTFVLLGAYMLRVRILSGGKIEGDS